MPKDNISIDWQGADEMINRLTQLENRVQWAIKQVALFWGPKMVAYAQLKENAKWNDRTGNARASIHYTVEEVSETIVKLYLSGGVDYFIHLETGFAGRYSVLWPTIQRHLPEIQKMLDEAFKS